MEKYMVTKVINGEMTQSLINAQSASGAIAIALGRKVFEYVSHLRDPESALVILEGGESSIHAQIFEDQEYIYSRQYGRHYWHKKKGQYAYILKRIAEGCSIEEIGQMFDESEGVIRTILKDGMVRFRLINLQRVCGDVFADFKKHYDEIMNEGEKHETN